MSKSNWLHIIAIGGCLIGSLLAGGTFAKEYDPIETPQQTTPAEKDSPSSDPFPISGPVLSKAEIADAEEYEKACRQPGTRDYADLCQQWRMAQMASKQVDLIDRQLTMIGVEIFLLLVTFGAGFWLSLRTDRTSRAQLRAYVMVSITRHAFQIGKVPRAQVVLKNFGASPAHGVSVWGEGGYQKFPVEGPLPVAVGPPATSHPLAPSGEVIIEIRFPEKPLTDEAWNKLVSGTHALFAVGGVQYKDAYGKPHKTLFCLFIGGPVGMDGGMAPYTEGNDAT